MLVLFVMIKSKKKLKEHKFCDIYSFDQYKDLRDQILTLVKLGTNDRGGGGGSSKKTNFGTILI